MQSVNVTFTPDELVEVQSTIVSRMLELNQKLEQASGAEAEMTYEEIFNLGRIAEKFKEHQTTVDL